MDFSKAMIAGSVKALYGSTTASYLNEIWNALVNGTKCLPAIHICRIHCVKFIFEAIKRYYADDQDSLILWSEKWTPAFVRSKNLKSLDRRIRDVAIIAGNKYQTRSVDEAINNIGRSTPKESKLRKL